MKQYQIAVIPGDGVGPEVIREGMKVLDSVSKNMGTFSLRYEIFPWSCQYFHEHGEMMPGNALEILSRFDSIYLGAIGHPSVPDHISLWGLLLPIRKGFDQYINLRPIKLLAGVPSPLANKKPEDIDIIFVRENTEGEYAGIGRIMSPGTPDEKAEQLSVFTRTGTERVIRYAFNVARERGGKLAGITKSNALNYSMVFWDKIFKEVASDYPEVNTRLIHVDAAAMYMVKQPEMFDVIVASNLFGDILTDLGAAIQGGMGFAAGGNISPTRNYPSMFEPIHGSAPDIAGTGQANPIAAIWAGAMMLDHIGEHDAASVVIAEMSDLLRGGTHRTPDIGGNAKTCQIGDAITSKIMANITHTES